MAGVEKKATPQIIMQILTKNKTRLRVREVPISSIGVLGTMVDAMNLPEGHMSCGKCHGHRFECSGYVGGNKVEMGCEGCGDRFYVAFPLDVVIPDGRYYCRKHPSKGMILIHNIDVVSIGCESCKTQILIQLKKAGGLVLADG